MPTNPSKPPETDSPRNPRPPATPGSPLKAVLIGLAVDIGGTWVLSAVLSIFQVIQLMGQGLSESEVRQALENPPHDSALYVGATLLGASMSVLGGYVCARIARRDEYRAGAVMAAVSAVFGVMMAAHPAFDEMTLLLTVTGIACNLLGVKYGAEHNRRAEAPADPSKDSSTS
jgi:hypothetical protein